MNKLFLFIHIIFTATFLSCAQNENKTKEISNKISENHLPAIGSKWSFIPPPGFTQAISFSGFQQEETNSSIMVVELPSPFEDIAKSITKEGLMTKGIELDYTENYIVNGYKSILIHAKQSVYDTEFSKLIFIFGDEENSVMINGVCPKDSIKLISEITKSIFSVVYDTSEIISPVDAVRFSIDVSDSKFKLGKLFSGSLLYTVDGQVPTQSYDKTNLIVVGSIGKVIINDPKEFSINRMKQLPAITQIKDEDINKVIIDKMNGYEIVSYGQDEKTFEPEMVYQLILFEEDEYYMIVGTAKENFEENLNTFKKVSKTFKVK